VGGVLLDMAVSLDGLICGPDGSDGGLYDWYFDASDASRPVLEELVKTTGAIVIGRGAFGRGDDAVGWTDTPYAVPHLVVTHRPPRRPTTGPVEFVFVPEGVRSAIERARPSTANAGRRSVEGPTSRGRPSLPDWWTRSSCTSSPCFWARACRCSIGGRSAGR
jgi:dihydrofolate reductase